MPVIELNESNFESTVSGPGIVMVDCWASWCAACRDFGPVFERVAARHPEHVFGKLDTEKEKVVTSKLALEHIPTLVLFRDGILLFLQPGYFEEDKLEDIVRQAESLDMDEVRAHIEAEVDSRSPETG
jgi:thioredoxin 1